MAPKTFTAVGSALALAIGAAAHGHVSGLVADSIYYEGYDPSMQYESPPPSLVAWSTPSDLDNGFVAPSAYTSADIICHKNATPGAEYATVKAGDTVEVERTEWPPTHQYVPIYVPLKQFN